MLVFSQQAKKMRKLHLSVNKYEIILAILHKKYIFFTNTLKYKKYKLY